MIPGVLLAAAFVSVVLVIYWLTEKPKRPRSEYTLPPLKRTIQQRVEAGEYGERLESLVWDGKPRLKHEAGLAPSTATASTPRKDLGEPGQIIYWESSTPAEPVSEETRKLYEEIYEKPRAEMERQMTQKALDGEFGDEVKTAFESAEHHHTKDAFVEAMVESKPDETLSHSDRIDHDHGGSHE